MFRVPGHVWKQRLSPAAVQKPCQLTANGSEVSDESCRIEFPSLRANHITKTQNDSECIATWHGSPKTGSPKGAEPKGPKL